jgi:hypothetical protein
VGSLHFRLNQNTDALGREVSGSVNPDIKGGPTYNRRELTPYEEGDGAIINLSFKGAATSNRCGLTSDEGETAPSLMS